MSATTVTIQNVLIKKPKKVSTCVLDYNEYFKNKMDLTKLKIPDLKNISKENRLRVTGTKPALIDRIKTHFINSKNAVIIQCHFRGWITRTSIRLRGPGFKNRKLCVNDTDFVTMEPLIEIDYENFYSYEDNKKFIYGFNIVSLIQLLKNNGKISNPYNRENIDFRITIDIKRLYRLSYMLYDSFKQENEPLLENVSRNRPSISRNTWTPNNITPIDNIRIENVFVSNPDQQNRLNRLREIRTQTTEQRIQCLFMEIDQLGNYTQVEWFSSLNIRDLVRFYRYLYDIWNFRGQLSRELRTRICPMNSPFDFDNNVLRSQYPVEINILNLKTTCLTLFENFVYTGIDDEHRRLGAFHSLSALTMVSPGARNALPWLFESVM